MTFFSITCCGSILYPAHFLHNTDLKTVVVTNSANSKITVKPRYWHAKLKKKSMPNLLSVNVFCGTEGA